MRFVVFLLGLFAVFLTALGGAILVFANYAIDELGKQGVEVSESLMRSPTGFSNANTGLVMLVTAAYGFLGAVFALFRCGKQGGSLMLIPVLGTGFLNPYFLAFMSVQAFVGLLSFFVGPLPLNPPKKKEEDGGDDEDAEDDED